MDLTKLTRNEIRHARDIAFQNLDVPDSLVVYDEAEGLAHKIAGLSINDAVRVLAAIGEKLIEGEVR